MIRVLVDSSADFTKEEIDANNMLLIPLNITVDGDKSYHDEIDITRKEIYKLMVEENRTVKTSQASPQEFLEIFEKVKEAGDEVICILLSSTLSGTCQSAQIAKTMCGYDKIYIVDSLAATVNNQVMAYYALKQIQKGKTAEEIVASLNELKGRIRIYAALDTLKYLYLGGRVSKTTAIVADAVSVKPGITLTKEGAVGVGSKYLGMGRAIKDLVKTVKNATLNPEHPVYLIYSYNPANAEKLHKAMTDAGIPVKACLEIGATLGVHIGPGAVGVVYVEK